MIKSFKNIVGDEKKYLSKKTIPNKEAVFYIFKEAAQECFGKIGLGNLVPKNFFKGTLFIEVQSPMWSSELWINREGVVREINKKLGKTFVQEIKVEKHL